MILMYVRVYASVCVLVCMVSGWCPGDLMANSVCFHGLVFQSTAHRNAERAHTHTTYGVLVKCSANTQEATSNIQSRKRTSSWHYAQLLIFTIDHVEMDHGFCLDVCLLFFIHSVSFVSYPFCSLSFIYHCQILYLFWHTPLNRNCSWAQCLCQ